MPRAVIVGLGLIGGSIARAVSRRGWEVFFVDPAVSADEASRADERWIRLDSLEAIPRNSDVIVIATPVDAALKILRQIPEDSGFATTVCSVMAPLQRRASETKLRFAASHPFAGSAEHGLAASREDLFEGKIWFVDSASTDHRLHALVSATGAVAQPIEAEEHDRLLAATSHLPQVLSTALGSMLESESLGHPALRGSGLETFLRLAGSSGEVWRPVLESNRVQVREQWLRFSKIVDRIIDGLDTNDFTKAQRLRATIENREK